MEYKETKPCAELQPFIHCFWELNGSEHDRQWERNFPDGCPGLVMNLGDACLTDNGSVSMEPEKTYVVGTMTSFKDSFIDSNTHLLGVCFKPAAFANFYRYASQHELTDQSIALERADSFRIDSILKNPSRYLNGFFTDRMKHQRNPLQEIVAGIHASAGQLSISELSKRNRISARQLERQFKMHIGISPKEYSNIIRFQHALNNIRTSGETRSFLDIAFDCGYYDHAHLSNEIRRHTGLSPSQL